MKKTGVFIGRFQPPHPGHIAAIAIAASQVDELLILVGSANQCRSIKNPWTFSERKNMLFKKLRTAGVTKFKIFPVNDHPYNDPAWITEVKQIISSVSLPETKPILFGHMKEGNNYLKWFPDWGFREVGSQYTINATQVREKMFEDDDPEIPQTVKNDWYYYQREAHTFRDYPFPETLNFNCGDALVLCLDKVLLIERGRAPGRGAWALPGGFKNANETFLDCAIRELQEETNIRVPEKVLRGSIVKTQLFDSPKRSFGIPRNTLAVMIRIQPDPDGKPPRINRLGSDDAGKCDWFDLDYVLNCMELYDDHGAIIAELTGTVPRVKLD